MRNRLLFSAFCAAFIAASCGRSGEVAESGDGPGAEETPELVAPGVDTPSLQATPADPSPIGWPAKTLPEIAVALQTGEASAVDVVEAYLARIEAVDRAGATLQSVLTVNPNALEEARARDAAREAGEIMGPLHGVPILLKDNIESADPMPTTAGSLALKDNMTGRDAPLAAGLRAAGAIILGKTNLSQWANFRSDDSMSGWSALGGQVRNPHVLDRNPCGSSSGSGAAMAASLAAGAVGTETNGSIICPSNANGVVGFKPTVGLVSQQYIVPISSSQDTAGPMTKTVAGAAMMLSAMAVPASGDGLDYLKLLEENALAGARVGVLRSEQGSNADIIALFDAAIGAMAAAGAEIVEIDDYDFDPDEFWPKARKLLHYEFKATINDYLADAAPGVVVRSLDDLIAFNETRRDVELALFDQSIFERAAKLGDLETPEYIEHRDYIQRATREDGLEKIMADHNVDVLVSPSGPLAPRVDPVNGDVWPAWAGAGWMAAIAGYPHLTVPMGSVHGLPVGVSFIALAGEDAKVLSFGYAYERRTAHRRDPAFLPTAEERPEIASAMKPYRP